jgi:ribosomal protein L11 methyltransferase
MPWLQLHIVTNRADADALEELLLACGAVSVTLTDNEDNPILEPGVGETPLWESIKASALFDVATDRDAVARTLGLAPQAMQWEDLEDQPWERSWMEHFHPIQCGERLWICPSWQEPPDPDGVNLILDPGLAFGSGTHPTTFLCLQWLDKQPLTGKTVIDYGCGSGILGIAALLLGAASVVAVDNDPQALIATRDNLARNNLPNDSLETYLPTQLPALNADIVIANILAEPLIALAHHITDLLVAGGSLCLSGILSHQADSLINAYSQIDFDSPVIDDNWARLNGAKVL